MAETVEVNPAYEPEAIAQTISDTYDRWNQSRSGWLTEVRSLREFLFSTSTNTTQVAANGWHNSTVTPKLTQIRDNLHANYMAALFPKEDWFEWEADDKEAAMIAKKDAITAYMKQKLAQSGFEIVVEKLVLDYIDKGNVFAGVEYVKDAKTLPSGERVENYIGPKVVRYDPVDIVMDPTAVDFANTPFIRRISTTLADVMKKKADLIYAGYDWSVIEKGLEVRQNLTNYIDQLKAHALAVDGFDDYETYFRSGRVELLQMWGDFYDVEKGVVYVDQIITIMDRRWVVQNVSNPSWIAGKPVYHCGWRVRPENLWAQGPLDQLQGMQYRIDHLENLKADVFDQIANPMLVVKGTNVTDFKYGPGEKIFVGEDGDVQAIRPDSTALNADMQINELMQRMEDLAGAPRQAMGIRTPGEKTKYEVQVLENGAGRIFMAKIAWLEKNLIEPVLNAFLESAQRNLGGAEKIRMVDPEFKTVTFVTITKDDINGNGRLRPVGSRHFAEQARFVQELTQFTQGLQNMPTVAPHISGKRLADAFGDTLGLNRWGIVQYNVAVAEALETEQLKQSATENLQATGNQPSEMAPTDMIEGAPPSGDQVPAGQV